MSAYRSLSLLIVSLSIVPSAAAQRRPRPAPVVSEPRARYDSTLIQAMRWRSIGPYRGGRVTAVAGVEGQPFTYYFGATGGGVWKTTDGGSNWLPVADSILGAGSIGAIE